jgi:hypothetical protein
MNMSKRLNMSKRRFGVAVVAAGVTAAAIGVVGASEADAYSGCSTSSAQLNDGSAAMSITVQRYCSDGRSHIFGTLSDIKCDARSARGTIKFWNGDYLIAYRIEYPDATNGCGTSATFSYSSTNTHPRICAWVFASNGGPTQSKGDSACL